LRLLDNKTIASNAASEDRRILRWQAEIRDTGCVELGWLPGEFNTIRLWIEVGNPVR
jgi:hypothetical protein